MDQRRSSGPTGHTASVLSKDNIMLDQDRNIYNQSQNQSLGDSDDEKTNLKKPTISLEDKVTFLETKMKEAIVLEQKMKE